MTIVFPEALAYSETFFMEERIAVYPGTFDPITRGHLDVLRRATKIFDKVILGISPNAGKRPLFDAEERFALAQEVVRDIPRTEVQMFDSLTVEFVRSIGAIAIVRGLRVVSDFEHEFQMAMMNRSLDADIETIFLMPSEEYFFTSSSLIRQVAHYSKDVDRFVTPNVKRALQKKIA